MHECVKCKYMIILIDTHKKLLSIIETIETRQSFIKIVKLCTF